MTDQEDFKLFLGEIGVTEEQMADAEKRVRGNIKLAPSAIHGIGVFAPSDFPYGEFVATLCDRGSWTLCGHFTNHSNNPNTLPISDENHAILLRVIRPIKAGEEITVNYRDVKKIKDDYV